MRLSRWRTQLLLPAAWLLLACPGPGLLPSAAQDDTLDEYYGRYHASHAAPRCCTGLGCVAADRGRYAFVTSVRTPDYILGLQELHCSLQRSNPNVTLIIIGIEGDLEPHHVAKIRDFGEYRLVEDIKQENRRFGRFAKNWMKLRVWAWDEFDAIILLDSDMVVLQAGFHIPEITLLVFSSKFCALGWGLDRPKGFAIYAMAFLS
jgi:hypothetical protein